MPRGQVFIGVNPTQTRLNPSFAVNPVLKTSPRQYLNGPQELLLWRGKTEDADSYAKSFHIYSFIHVFIPWGFDMPHMFDMLGGPVLHSLCLPLKTAPVKALLHNLALVDTTVIAHSTACWI